MTSAVSQSSGVSLQELLTFGPAALYSASGFVAALLVFALLCTMAHLAHCFVGRLPNAGIAFAR